jgi:hypothetical protein
MIASAPTTTAVVRLSPISATDHSTERTGCTSWIWLTVVIGPMASPRYQAKKPRNMLTADT